MIVNIEYYFIKQNLKPFDYKFSFRFSQVDMSWNEQMWKGSLTNLFSLSWKTLFFSNYVDLCSTKLPVCYLLGIAGRTQLSANIYDKTTEHILYNLDQSTEWFAERCWKHEILPPANRIFLSVLSKTIMPNTKTSIYCLWYYLLN